ncbi:MAG: nucleotidyltransferase domain-containing protein [bacterium]|nr:nucleotidyltransferase domain-containing protein [bacterium]
MSRDQIKKLAKQYRRILTDNGLVVNKMFLFGSYAQGKPNRWSDIDIAVVIDKTTGWWSSQRFVSRLSLLVDNRLEPHVFNIKDFANDADPLVYEIKKTGIRV